MTCSRCHGFMVQERLYDLQDTSIHTDAWRCTNCGDLADSIILKNREAHRVRSIAGIFTKAA